jgi:hypothetical protein
VKRGDPAQGNLPPRPIPPIPSKTPAGDSDGEGDEEEESDDEEIGWSPFAVSAVSAQ